MTIPMGIRHPFNLALTIGLILSMSDTSKKCPPIAKPKKKLGKWVCVCIAQETK